MTVPARRARSARQQVTIAVVALVLGVLVVAQLRAQGAAPALAGLSAPELTVLVGSLNSRNDQLRVEIAGLEQQLADLNDAESRGESTVDQLTDDLSRIRTWAGVVAVTGPGVTITVEGEISAGAVQDLLNELRNAGAEAIAIGGTRVVAATVVAGPPGGLSTEDTALTSPFEIVAIGSPQTLAGSLTRTGGVIAQIAATEPAARLTVTPGERVELPATSRDLVPGHGRPRL
jgi:uncharacterized protein YlxW (UPF0749 family)